jgi:hypothetical protein
MIESFSNPLGRRVHVNSVVAHWLQLRHSSAADVEYYILNIETRKPSTKRLQLSGINFQRTYRLSEAYESIQERAAQFLHKCLECRDLITFNVIDRSVTFSTERLIPTASTDRPRVMLLFSNPHPHSVHQGMFLSPNTRGQENLFWPVMEDAGWLPIAKENRHPKQLADICVHLKYPGPFDLIFYCYYAFPTDFPEDIRRIFGNEYFRQVIEPEALDEFRKTIHETSVEAVVTFNKGIFNRVSEDPLERCVERLMEGERIQSQVNGLDRHVPIFLTFPTGWRYHKQYRQFRKASLDTIRTAICSRSNVPEGQNP